MNWGQCEDSLLHATVEFKESSVPTSFDLSSFTTCKGNNATIADLLAREISVHRNDREMQLLSEYTEMKAEREKRKQKEEEEGALNASANSAEEAVAIESCTVKVADTPIPPTITTTASNTDSAVKDNGTDMSHEDMVVMMVSSTDEDKDICTFYLQSANWDLQAAVVLYQQMKG